MSSVNNKIYDEDLSIAKNLLKIFKDVRERVDIIESEVKIVMEKLNLKYLSVSEMDYYKSLFNIISEIYIHRVHEVAIVKEEMKKYLIKLEEHVLENEKKNITDELSEEFEKLKLVEKIKKLSY